MSHPPFDGSPMGSEHLQRFIGENNIAATLLPMAQHTATVTEAALALGVESDQIIKSLVFRLEDEPILVINNGLARVDRRQLAAALGVGRKRVKFASPDLALDVTGYAVGSMPPFGHRKKIRTLMDSTVPSLDVVFGGGGDIHVMMRLTVDELSRVTRPEIFPLCPVKVSI
jgi:Cys-tRNA(Pro) deacylase